jgi:hypothetical protein
MPTIPYKNKAGQKVKGVTTIIGNNLGWGTRGLMYWSWNCGMHQIQYKDMAKNAADSGTLCHYLCTDFYLQNLPLDENYVGTFTEDQQTKAWQGLESFKAWFVNNRFTIYRAEVNLVSEEFQYGLTPDCIVKTDSGELALVDLKTGKGPYESMLIQLAAYKHGWDENFPAEPLTQGFHLLRIGKEDASFHHHYWAELPGAWDAFLHLRALEEIQQMLKARL